MNIKKLNEKQMPLLDRKRIDFELNFSGPTPSRENLKKEIAKITNTKEELIAIRHIYQRYGINKGKVITHIYDKEESLKEFEPRKKEQKAKTEDKKEEPKKEIKSEEKKEDDKKEQKQEVKEDGKEKKEK